MKRKMPTDEMLRLLFVANLFSGVSTKGRGGIEESLLLNAQKGRDLGLLARREMEQRVDALLSKSRSRRKGAGK